MSTFDGSCNVGASKSSSDGVCDVNDMLQNMSTTDKDEDVVSVCANCGKEGAGNTCNKCKKAKYCSAACKKKHRHKHKKDCEEHLKLAAEHAAKLHDEKLFKQPPPNEEDCPICFLRLPTLHTGSTYKSCCGKVICSGCIHAPLYDDQGNKVDNRKCPFCRIPTPYTEKEGNKRLEKRVEAGDAYAIYELGYYYSEGMYGYPQDHKKTLELYYRAAELGYTEAYCNIGSAYKYGQGVKVDEKEATHYWELAAMGGSVTARYNLGILEEQKGNMDRAMKHHMIAVRDGHADSLEQIKDFYTNGHATKDYYTKALQSYQAYIGEIKSEQRDKAAAAREDYHYY